MEIGEALWQSAGCSGGGDGGALGSATLVED
jgi:hypothetical protein